MILALAAALLLALAPFGGGSVAAQANPAAAGSYDTLTVTRLKYDGGGDWYGDPSALPNLLAAIRDRTGIKVAAREQVVSLGDPGLADHPYLYMTGHGNVSWSPAERQALREYLIAGGFLHADDNYGMDESFRREIQAVFPDQQLVEVPLDHPIYHLFYDFPKGLPKIHEHDGKRAQGFGIVHEGRLVVFYSYESDLGNGWEDPEVYHDPAELHEAALRMGVNLFLYALQQEVRP